VTIARVVDTGTSTAQAVIDAAARAPGDPDAALLRVGVLHLLHTHANDLTAEGGDDDALLKAYQDWLEVALALYTTGNEDLVETYMSRATVLQADMDKAAGRVSAGPAES
jgi:hypothetical protein